MAFQPSADFFGIRCLGFKCRWWQQRQVNDAVASERSIFSESHDYKSFSGVAMNTYIPILRGLDARGGRKLRTDTQTLWWPSGVKFNSSYANIYTSTKPQHLHTCKTYFKYKTYFFVRTMTSRPCHFSHMRNAPLAVLCTINLAS